MRRVSSRAQRRGATLVLAAILLVVLIGMVAFAIDVGYLCLARTQLQVAADAAAMGGVASLKDGPAASRAAASRFAGMNSAAGQPVSLAAADVHLGTWDDDAKLFTQLPAAEESNANAIKVFCRRSAVGLFFGRILGTSSADALAQATARVKPTICGLIIGRTKVTMSGSSHTDSYNSTKGAYNAATAAEKGHVCSDGPITMSGSATIHGDARPGEGFTVSMSGSADVTGEVEPRDKPLNLPAIDPGDAATNNNNSHIPNSAQGKQPLNSSKKFSLSGGDSVNLPPGTYYFSELSLSGGSSINISGSTTIYVTGDVSLSGGTILNPTMLPKNLQLFPMGSKCTISGSSAFYGAIYGPDAKVERSGDADYYGMIVGKEVVLSGEGGIHVDESLGTLQGGQANVALVQ